MGGVVCRGDCDVCGWKDRCRDANLRTYCHVSPILFVCFFLVEVIPTCFCIFCETLFLELVAFILKKFFFPVSCFYCFFEVKR